MIYYLLLINIRFEETKEHNSKYIIIHRAAFCTIGTPIELFHRVRE